jgi:hypothetical protein
MAEPFTGYWKPEQGFENIPKFNDKKAELLKWIRKCDAADGYPLFRLYQEEGKKYPNHSVLISCYGGEVIEPEAWWLRDVPKYVLDRLEREVNGYDWLISYIVEGKTDNPNGNPNHEFKYDWEDELVSVGGKVLPDDTVWLYHATKREIANEILKTGILKTAHGAPKEYGIYFGSNSSVGFDYGDGTVIPVRVKAENLHPDDIFPERRMDFMIKAREYRPVEIGKPFNVRETNSAHNPNGNPNNPHNNPNHNEDDVWQQRDATQERILDRLKLKESGVKIDEPPILVTVGATHTVVGEVDGLKLNFALDEIAREDVPLFDTFRIGDRLWHVKKSIALSTLKGRQKARDKREGKQMKMYEEWGGLAKFEKKEEFKPQVAPPYELIKKKRLSQEELEQLKVDITELKRVRELWRAKLPGYEAKQAIIELDRDIADYEVKLKEFEPKEEYKPTTVIEKLADDAIHKRGWWQDKL